MYINHEELCFITDSHTSKDLDLTILNFESVLIKLIENELVIGDLPDLKEGLMYIKNPPFLGAKIGFDSDGNPIIK